LTASISAAQRLRIIVGAVAGDGVELGVEHPDDLGRLVVDDLFGFFVPQGGHRYLAGVARIAGDISLVEILKAVDLVRDAIRIARVVAEGPAVRLQAGDRIGDGNQAIELLQRAIDQGAVCPRAAMRHIEVIAARLGLEARRAVGGNAAVKHAVGPLELPGLAGLLRQLTVGPLAVDQNAHD
jgi:hypothetical protein